MTATFDIRKIVTLRDVTYAELGHKPARPIVRAVGMAVIHNPGKYAEDLRQLWEAGAELGERLTPELVKMLDAPPVSYGKGAIVRRGAFPSTGQVAKSHVILLANTWS